MLSRARVVSKRSCTSGNEGWQKTSPSCSRGTNSSRNICTMPSFQQPLVLEHGKLFPCFWKTISETGSRFRADVPGFFGLAQSMHSMPAVLAYSPAWLGQTPAAFGTRGRFALELGSHPITEGQVTFAPAFFGLWDCERPRKSHNQNLALTKAIQSLPKTAPSACLELSFTNISCLGLTLTQRNSQMLPPGR